MNKIQKQKEIISKLEKQKKFRKGQKLLDLNVAIVDAMEKLNKLMYPERKEL